MVCSIRKQAILMRVRRPIHRGPKCTLGTRNLAILRQYHISLLPSSPRTIAVATVAFSRAPSPRQLVPVISILISNWDLSPPVPPLAHTYNSIYRISIKRHLGTARPRDPHGFSRRILRLNLFHLHLYYPCPLLLLRQQVSDITRTNSSTPCYSSIRSSLHTSIRSRDINTIRICIPNPCRASQVLPIRDFNSRPRLSWVHRTLHRCWIRRRCNGIRRVPLRHNTPHLGRQRPLWIRMS